MTETPFYFPSGERSLFGILHEPARATTMPAFVFCHPFAEEKLWAQRVFVSFARRLAAEGHPVLRFDYMGNGDSEGDIRDSSLSTALADVRCAVDEVRRRTGRTAVSLLGLRLGATIASLVAEDVAGVEHLVLWAPVVDGARYMQEVLRINLTTQMATFKEIRQDREALVAAMVQGQSVNVDGYEMTHRLYAEVSGVTLAADRKRHGGPCLIAQIDRQPGRPSAELLRLAAAYERATTAVVQEEPFWKEILRFYDQAPNLFPATLEWLRTVDASVRH
ncbi:MAG: serine aminopeptidase domain-containing protein [Vicinamibacterales bacterium]